MPTSAAGRRPEDPNAWKQFGSEGCTQPLAVSCVSVSSYYPLTTPAGGMKPEILTRKKKLLFELQRNTTAVPLAAGAAGASHAGGSSSPGHSAAAVPVGLLGSPIHNMGLCM